MKTNSEDLESLGKSYQCYTVSYILYLKFSFNLSSIVRRKLYFQHITLGISHYGVDSQRNRLKNYFSPLNVLIPTRNWPLVPVSHIGQVVKSYVHWL